MPDVLIRGMEMPKDRPQLLWVYPNGKAMTVQSDVDPWKELQAVPVPQHGRLIDADALYEDCALNHGYEVMATTSRINEYMQLEIDAAPTIIPAEEG